MSPLFALPDELLVEIARLVWDRASVVIDRHRRSDAGDDISVVASGFNNRDYRSILREVYYGHNAFTFAGAVTLHGWLVNTGDYVQNLVNVTLAIGARDTVERVDAALIGIGQSHRLLNVTVIVRPRMYSVTHRLHPEYIRFVRTLRAFRGLTHVEIRSYRPNEQTTFNFTAANINVSSALGKKNDKDDPAYDRSRRTK
jgi:hypothetical protein